MKDCVIDYCGCSSTPLTENTTEVNATELPSYEEFTMEEITERTIREAKRDDFTNEQCDTDCGTECLADSEVQFKAKEICMKEACNCQVNIFYQGHHCNLKCASKCLYLGHSEDEVQLQDCFTHCGCKDSYDNIQNFIESNEEIVSVNDTVIESNSTVNVTVEGVAMALFSQASATLDSVYPQMSKVKKTLLICLFIVFTISAFQTIGKVR